MAVLNGAENRSDSIKRLKAASALDQKLNSYQKMHVTINSALVSGLSKKYNSAQKLRQMYPESEIPYFITATKKKGEKQVLEYLKVSRCITSKSSISACPSILGLCLAVVQFYMSCNNYQAALDTLDSYLASAPSPIKYSFGIISLVGWLNESLNNHRQAKECLIKAHEYYVESGLLVSL